MRRLKRKFQAFSSRLLEIPLDVTLDLPRMTLIGNRQLYIENHRGVLHFSADTLLLGIAGGKLEIKGTGLTIRAILPEEVFVEGEIGGFQYFMGKG